MLLDNQYVFQSFWSHQSGKIDEAAWKARFASGKKAAQQALASGNTPALLGVLFNRLYTLRNQLIHGGATWNGSVNREPLRDCTNLLGKLVPLIIELMMDSADTLWGDACYPVARDSVQVCSGISNCEATVVRQSSASRTHPAFSGFLGCC